MEGLQMQVSGEFNVNIKFSVFWDMTQCSLVDIDVSEEHAASIFGVKE
jgi:hypothetical protein